MIENMMGEGAGVPPVAVGLGGDIPSIADLNKLVAGELMESPEEAEKERADFVKSWVKRVKESKTHFKDQFKRMRDDMEFVRGKQWDGQTDNDTRYVANITQRHVNQRVAALYAKNPTVVAKRRKTLDFQMWDESPDSIKEAIMQLGAAQQAAATLGAPPPAVMPALMKAQALLAEVQEVKARRQMMDKMGRTMEILFNYYMNEAQPTFKVQAKQMIRRAEICSVGYVKLGFQRAMQRRPDVSAKLGDMTERMSYLKRLAASVMSEHREGAEASSKNIELEMEELSIAIKSLMQEPEVIMHEGLVFDFPRSTAIIIDKNCINLKGFVGADWIAHEFLFSHEEIEEIYGKDIKGKVTAYYQGNADGDVIQTGKSIAPDGTRREDSDSKVMVWEVYHKPSGTQFAIADGYSDYLDEPAPPKVKVERFWPIFALTFNDIEDEKDIYPHSDVRMIRAMQIEHNRAREGLREHRIANRPAYVGPAGVLEEQDKVKLNGHSINEFIELNIPVGTDVKTVIQPMQKVAIDPAIYDTSPFFDDVQKVVGAQEADFGGVSGVAATEISVAEGARINTLQSNIDDLDDFLSDLARAASQIMLREVSVETAKKIAGQGAVWPQLSAQDLSDELYLEIEAGSSGRPNRAQEIASLERIAPTLLQVPGINPAWLAKIVVRVVDDSVDLTEAVLESMPSMTAINSMSGNPQPATGDPATDPAQQGGQGSDTSKNPQDRGGGAQPSYRQPADNRQ